ncbi:MAG: tryptophan--tRNA ligase [Candidatus Neomarinimicrobiota bacterium]|nr:tryptophan--tRNA ligase [Candidatus Neomarinimicrobiota bacterium]
MKRVLSGIQPSGSLHIGNYFGMMKRMIKYQDENDLFSCIVNYHALTTINDPEVLKNNTINATLDFFALGLDPEKSTFWIQGDIPHVTEFTWIISNVTNVGLIERSTSYKDKISRGIMPNMGLFSYPMLMASDILCFGSEIVPVGKDQKQHLEIARDIAIKFNNIYGDILIIPTEDIDEDTQLIPGIDGQKMSKSYNNIIPIFGDENFIKKQIMSIVTDSTPVDEPKDLDSPIYRLFSLFLNESDKQILENKFLSSGLQYGKVKEDLFDTFMDYFKPFRQKREYLSNNLDHVLNHLEIGSKKATLVANEIIDKVRTATGLNYSIS